jgi:hypothetical protein
VLDGRQFGNLVVVAAHQELPAREYARRAAADTAPAVVASGPALDRLVAGAAPITDARPVPPADPPPGISLMPP